MSGRRLPNLKPREVIRALEKAGFVKWRQKGSHLGMYRHTDRRALTVPVHFSKTIPKGTLHSILRSAALSLDEFLNLLK